MAYKLFIRSYLIDVNTNAAGSVNPTAYIQVTKPINIISSAELRRTDECMGKYNLQIFTYRTNVEYKLSS